jgi:hypothetical protein
MSRLGSDYGAYARVAICRACGGGFIPPAHGNCCSERCVAYLAAASQPELGNSIFCQRDEPIKCWGCEVRFRSSGLRYCPTCFFRAHLPSECETATKPLGHPYGCVTPAAPRPVRTYEPIQERDHRSRCHW